jgi:hypothetical protein
MAREFLLHWIGTSDEHLLSSVLILAKTVLLFEFDLSDAKVAWVFT